MTNFKIHTIETAPEASVPVLETINKNMGFVPNLFGALAEAPAAIEAYAAVMDIFERSSLSNAEKQTVLLSASLVNDCEYCMAAHTAVAGLKRVPADIIDALRIGGTLPDPKLDALAGLTRSVVETRGWPSEAAKKTFFDAGYGTREYLEVIVGVSLKTISSHVNHAVGTPLDAAFEPVRWAA